MKKEVTPSRNDAIHVTGSQTSAEAVRPPSQLRFVPRGAIDIDTNPLNQQYRQFLEQLERESCTWLVTGAAGFIGSNLVESLLKLNQRVIGLDNFSTGH